jgi:hypothetical protein
LIIFRSLFKQSILDPFCRHFTCGTSWGWKIDFLGPLLTPQNRNLLYSSVYIFRSERSALRPPKKWHFWPPHWSKSTAYLWGMGFPIGPFMGVDFGGRKGGSFCRKLQNFKKFRFGGSGSPRSKFIDFSSFLTPPMEIKF